MIKTNNIVDLEKVCMRGFNKGFSTLCIAYLTAYPQAFNKKEWKRLKGAVLNNFRNRSVKESEV